MATKTLYFKNVTVNGALSLQDGGTAPTGALTATGWTMAKLATPNHSIMAVGTKKASGTFAAADALATPTFTAGSCWRSENPFTGTFANANWSMAFRIRAGTASSQTGAVKVRLWKSTNATGTGATQLTSSVLVGTTTAALSTTTSATSTVTWTSDGSARTFTNEYLWVQCEWSIVATSGSNNGDAIFYVESAGAITTPNFLQSYTLTADTETPAFAITDVGTPVILRRGRRVIADSRNFSINGSDTGLPFITPWTPFNIDLTYTQIAENVGSGQHYATRTYTNYVAGDSYLYCIEYQGLGANPRGLTISTFTVDAGNPSFLVGGSNTGVETSFSNTGYWTLNQHSVTATSNGYFKALVQATINPGATVAGNGTVTIYLTAAAGAQNYTGDGSSGVLFRNYKGLHYSRFDAANGVYSYTGNDATLTKMVAAINYSFDATNGVYGTTGQAAILKFNHCSLEANGIYSIAGQATTFYFNHRSLEANGGYSYTGQTTTALRFNHRSLEANGVYGLVEQIATFKLGYRSLEANGVYGITGQVATFKFIHRSLEANGIYGLAGQAVTFKLRYQLAAANSVYSYADQVTTLIYVPSIKGISAFNGVYNYSGQVTGLTAIRFLFTWDKNEIVQRDGQTIAQSDGQTITAYQVPVGYTYTGRTAVLRDGNRSLEANGVYGITGQTTTALTAKRTIALANGAYSITGSVTTLRAVRKLALANTIYTYTGNTSTLRIGYKCAAANTAYSIAGQIAAFKAVRQLIAANTSYSISGKVATFKLRYQIAATQGTYTFAGQAAALIAKGRMDTGTFTITGSPAILRRSRLFPCANTSYASTGQPATLKLGRRVIAANTVYAISGKDILYKLRYQAVAAKGTYSYTGQVTTLKLGRVLTAANDAYALSGKNNTFKVFYRIGIVQGSYQLIAGDTRLTQRVEYEIAANSGTYNVIGRVANFRIIHRMICQSGAYLIDANDIEKIHIHKSYCVSGLYGFTGYAATLEAHTGSFPGQYGVAGTPVTFIRTYRHVSGGMVENKPKNSLSGSLLVIPNAETGEMVVTKPRDAKSSKMYELADKITAVKTF